MTKDEKKKKINEFIKMRYPYYFSITNRYLSNKKRTNKNDHIELLHQILFSIYERIDSKELNFFYKLLLEDNIDRYIIRTIYNNCQSNKAPFIYQRNKYVILEKSKYWDKKLNINLLDDEEMVKRETKEKLEDDIIEYINFLTMPKNAKEMFGNYWSYYIKIWKLKNNDISFGKLSLKLNIPVTGLWKDYTFCNNKIKEKIYEKFKERLGNNSLYL